MLLCIILTTTARSGGCEEQSEFRNSYRHNIYIFFLKKTLILPYYPSPPKLSLHQSCTQNGKRSRIKGSLLTSRFANVTSVSSTRFLTVIRLQWRLKFLSQLTSQKENESDWKSSQRKTALNSKKKRNMLRLNTSKFIFNIPAKSY